MSLAPRSGIRLALVAGALLLTVALARPPASEAIGAGCQQINQSAQMLITADPGEKNRIAAGYRPGDQQIAVRDRNQNFLFGGCPGPYSQLSMVLGNRSDTARLDAKDQVLQQNNFRQPLAGHIDASLRGNRGNDRLLGHRGHDILRGGPGADHLTGLGRADIFDGGPGPDHLSGGSHSDLLRGDTGPDLIKAVDGFADVVRCGEGNDTADVDSRDSVRGCELVRVG